MHTNRVQYTRFLHIEIESIGLDFCVYKTSLLDSVCMYKIRLKKLSPPHTYSTLKKKLFSSKNSLIPSHTHSASLKKLSLSLSLSLSVLFSSVLLRRRSVALIPLFSSVAVPSRSFPLLSSVAVGPPSRSGALPVAVWFSQTISI